MRLRQSLHPYACGAGATPVLTWNIMEHHVTVTLHDGPGLELGPGRVFFTGGEWWRSQVELFAPRALRAALPETITSTPRRGR